ncbi:MAG: cardiolipin synthase, partial [Desulfofustis sp.]
FEATLIIYDRDFAGKIRTIQARYADQSHDVELEKVVSRPVFNRFKENVALLIGPLL